MSYYEQFIKNSVQIRNLNSADYTVISVGAPELPVEFHAELNSLRIIKGSRSVKLISGDIISNIKSHKKFNTLNQMVASFNGKDPDQMSDYSARAMVYILALHIGEIYKFFPSKNEDRKDIKETTRILYDFACDLVKDYGGMYVDDLYDTCERYAKIFMGTPDFPELRRIK